MTELVVVGDLHLNSLKFLHAFVEDPDDVIYKALDTVVSYANENAIENLIILGDIWDHPNPTQDSQRRFLRYLKSTGLNCYIIMGNHDVTSEGENSLTMSRFFAEELNDKIHIFTEPKVVKIEDVDFCFMPWPHSKSLLEGPGVNIAHITLKDAQGDSGRLLTKGEVIKKDKNQYWVIGDLHTNQRDKYVHYVGTLYQKNFGERLPKGFSHLNVEIAKGKLKVEDEFIINKPPFELVNLIIENAEDLDKIEPFNKQEIKLYKLKIKGEVVISPSFRIDNPHVYDIDYGKTKRIIEKNGKKISFKGVSNPLAGLREFLTKEGLSKKEINQAIRYSKSLKRNLEV